MIYSLKVKKLFKIFGVQLYIWLMDNVDNKKIANIILGIF
jgi:hypothetical protein